MLKIFVLLMKDNEILKYCKKFSEGTKDEFAVVLDNIKNLKIEDAATRMVVCTCRQHVKM